MGWKKLKVSMVGDRKGELSWSDQSWRQDDSPSSCQEQLQYYQYGKLEIGSDKIWDGRN